MQHLIRRFFNLLLLSLMTLSFSAASAGLTLGQYREWNRDPIKKEMLNAYLAGMGQGPVGRLNSPISGQVKLPHLNGL